MSIKTSKLNKRDGKGKGNDNLSVNPKKKTLIQINLYEARPQMLINALYYPKRRKLST